MLRQMLLRPRCGLHLGNPAGNRVHRRFPQSAGRTTASAISQARRPPHNYYRTVAHQRLYLPPAGGRPEKLRDLPRPPEPVQDLALLVEQPDQPKSLERGRTKMPRHKSRPALQSRTNTKNKITEKMVAQGKTNTQLLQKVAQVYDWLDSQIRQSAHPPAQCDACGKCCDFAQFDHRLFVTLPELMYLKAKLGDENLKPMPTSRCPYNADGECTVYDYRFAGCRIFSCKSNPDLQSALTESALTKLKSLCTEFHITYRYSDLPTALNSPKNPKKTPQF